MNKYRVIPVNGLSEAPYILVEVDCKEKNPRNKAIQIARPLTRLSDFHNWTFLVEQV